MYYTKYLKQFGKRLYLHRFILKDTASLEKIKKSSKLRNMGSLFICIKIIVFVWKFKNNGNEEVIFSKFVEQILKSSN